MTESRPTGSQAPRLTGSQALPGNPLPRGSASRSACAAWTEQLVDYSDGELPLDQQQAVQVHVAQCDGCRAELARLDASLRRLTAGICEVPTPSRVRLSARGPSGLHWSLAAAAAAILLTVTSLVAWNLNRPALIVHAPPTPHQKTPPAAAPLSPEAALRHIALVEQQARLQTSLDLMPHESWYAEQRAENQRLLTRFQEATLSIAVPTTELPPEGEAL
jgi:hypothetical protein